MPQRKHSLTHQPAVLLHLLGSSRGPVTLPDLEAASPVQGSQFYAQVRKLIEMGAAEEIGRTSDRKKVVRVTEDGRAMLDTFLTPFRNKAKLPVAKVPA